MKFSATTAFALACIAFTSNVSGLPMRRDEPTEKNIGDLMGSALAKWLSSQKVKDFRAIQGGKQVTWIGDTSTNVSSNAGNAILFKTADKITAFDDKDKESFFADAYKVFVQDLGEKLGLNATQESSALKDKETDADVKCGKVLSDVFAKASTELLDQVHQTDPNHTPTNQQLTAAVHKKATWIGANTDCESAKQAFSAAYDKEHGFNFALFAQANKNMRPIADALTTVVDGVTMPADSDATKEAGDDPFDPPTGQGNVLPLYTIPVLESTLKGWQARDDAAEPEFTWESKNEKTSSLKELSESSASVGVSFGRFGGHVGASNSEGSESTQTSAQEFSVKFGGITLMDVETGLWFDGYRMAAQAERPTDAKSAPAREIFTKHFGTKEKPLPAAHYNKQAVVAYRPSWTMKFSSSDSYHKFMESSFDVSAQYLFADVSASGKKMSDIVKGDTSSNTATYNPTSKNGVILGYVVESYQFGDSTDVPVFSSEPSSPTASSSSSPASSSAADASATDSAAASESASSGSSDTTTSADAESTTDGASATDSAATTDDASATDSATEAESTDGASATDSVTDAETANATDSATDAGSTDEATSTGSAMDAETTSSASAESSIVDASVSDSAAEAEATV